MKLIPSIITVLLIAGLVACGEKKKQEADIKIEEGQKMEVSKEGKGIAENERLVYYTCPMESHRHVHSENPGKCPECGMELVAVVETSDDKAEYYGCLMPMHSNVRHSEPGNCNECGMKLVPMRLVKT